MDRALRENQKKGKYRELTDGAVIDVGDVPLRALAMPGPRPDHVTWLIGDGDARTALTGDLDGVRGARSVQGPADGAAWTASRTRLTAVARMPARSRWTRD